MLHASLLEKPIKTPDELLEDGIYYPDSDGEPVGETDFHISAIFYLRQALRFLFRNVPDTYVAANMLFYYERGNPRRYKVPDVFVVKGIAKRNRRIYRLWEEQVTPCVIFEITSASTREEDTDIKRPLYAAWGVQEYFLFDPEGEYLKPRFQGFRLVRGHYEAIFPERDRSLFSQELQAILRPEEHLLRVVEADTGMIVPSLEEAAEFADDLRQLAASEAQRAEAEARRAEVAEAELARVQAELEQLKRQQSGAA